MKVGERIIFSDGFGYGLSEAIVEEISPSGDYIKLKNPANDCTYWRKRSEILVRETLG